MQTINPRFSVILGPLYLSREATRCQLPTFWPTGLRGDLYLQSRERIKFLLVVVI